MSINFIFKSDGSKVPFEPEKLNKWAEYASNHDVTWSDITLSAYRKCFDGCTTKDIHQAMIDSCVEKEDEKHLKMAGRLLLGAIYKEAHGGFKQIPTIKDFYHDMVSKNLWSKMDYTDEELDKLESVIDHDKNLGDNYTYTALKQMRDKYMVQDLVSKRCYESPQFMFMGVAMQSMEQQPKERRLEDIKNMYNYLSDLKVNLSTPMLVNLRTPKKGLASCCVYTTEDTAESLASGDHVAYMMTCASAGIGSHILTRSKGDPVRQGAVVHQGKLPYYRMVESAVHANKQACYDDKTEVLTESGFKLFKDLTEDDLVAQVDDRGNTTFVQPDEFFCYEFEGNLVSFNDNNGNSIVVTDNHKMSILKDESIKQDSDSNKALESLSQDLDESPLFHLVEAGELELSKNISFKLTANTKISNTNDISMKDLFMVFLISQGVDIKSKGSTVDLFDIQPNLFEHIEHLVTNLNNDGKSIKLHSKENPNSFIDSYDIKIQFKESLLEFFDNQKCTLLASLSSLQIVDLLDYLSFVTTDSEWIAIDDEVLENLVFSLLSLSGKGYTVEDREGIMYVKINHDQSPIVNSTMFTKTEVPYEGKVFCVQVPTHQLIVRRDNITMICGNSRGGANTTYFNVLDPEIMDLLVLKNPTTIQQKRIRNIDYALNVNRYFVECVAKNHDWFLISYYYAKDLYDAFYSSDYDKFVELFNKYKDHEKAVPIKAREIATKALIEAVETGRIYIHYVDEANRHTPFRTGEVFDGSEADRIYSSNLCVAPETRILTKEYGYSEIWEMEDEEVHVWNGEEWSKTTVVKTGEMQDLIRVSFSNGSVLECTKYHKFYIHNENGDIVKVEANDLNSGDKLINFGLPTIELTEEKMEFLDYSINSIGSVVDGQLVLSTNFRLPLEDVMLTLQEIGIKSNLISCERGYKLIVSNEGVGKLIDMGIEIEGVDLNVNNSNEDITVLNVESLGRKDDTYCFTEPKRNMGMFNGILTGQCLEIEIPTKAFTDIQDLYSEDPHGEIGLCSLSSIVLGRVDDEEYEDVAYYTLLLVDNTLEIMDYPFPSLRSTARARRNIGIGMTNMAYLMAKNNYSYSSFEGKKFIHYVAERHAYNLYKASLRLGKEKGNASWMNRTKYPEGWLPIDTYNKNVDNTVPNDLKFDWETLRNEIIENGGIRNSTVTAIPPNESSSLLTNTTNSIYPVRSLKVIKTSGTNRNILLAPEYEKLKNKYDIAWDMDSKDLIDLYSIVQKFTDQGISCDLYISYDDNENVSTRQLISDFIYMMKQGCKSRYYINSRSGVDSNSSAKNKVEEIDTSDVCESCVL